MQIALTIAQMFKANFEDFEVTQYADGSWELTKWNIDTPKPTFEEIEGYWVKNQIVIMEKNKPEPSETERLKKTLTDLSYDLMMNGVL